MFGIVLPITGAAETAIQAIWVELAQAFDLHIQPSLPHVSLHIAPEYDAAALRPVAAQFARTWPPFTLTTSGLGLFTVPEPVLYVAVTCGRDLLDCHVHLHPLAEPFAQASVPYYQPGRWVPHITLAHGPRLQSCLPDVIRLLGGRDYNWSIPVTQIAYINNPLITHETWSFQGQQSVASSQ